MADVTLTYKGQTILELSATGNKTIKTAGKYCEGDITLDYISPSGSGQAYSRDVNLSLPSGYKRLDYLTTDALSGNPSVSVPFTYYNSDYFCCRAEGAGYAVGENGNISWGVSIDTNSKTVNANGCSVHGESWDYISWSTDNPVTVICSPNSPDQHFQLGQSGSGYFSGKLYYLYILRDIISQNIFADDISRDQFVVLTLIPCYRESDGVNGFYDNVNDVFYTASSGTFGRGPEVAKVIRDWNFTKSLVDRYGNEAFLINDLTQNSSGLVFTKNGECADLGAILKPGVSIEIAISNQDQQSSTGYHNSLVMYGSSSSTSTGLLLFRAQGVSDKQWASYIGSWSYYNGLRDRNAFSGKTIRLDVAPSGYVSLYVDGVFSGRSTTALSSGPHRLYLGNSRSASNGGSIYNCTITGARITELSTNT